MNTEKGKKGNKKVFVEALVERGKVELMTFMDDFQGLCFTATSKDDKNHLRAASQYVQQLLYSQSNLLGAMEELLLNDVE